MDDVINTQAAIRWVKTECNPYGKPTIDFESGKKFIEHLEQMPAVQPTLYGYNIEHLVLIARTLQREDLPPERLAEILTDIGRIVTMVQDELEESLRKAVEQCKRM